MRQLSIITKKRIEMIDITGEINGLLKKLGIVRGICYLYVPHTTSGITINENADPAVKQDILDTLERIAPAHKDYNHKEGNADAHIKSSIIGVSLSLFIENGRLVLGTWQSVFFCEFDGPRTRSLLIEVAPL
ncbi:MAG: secondary thiamine-phosphate synthase enzyme YjbQ [bacterium]